MSPAQLIPKLREFCLTMPGAWEDNPWDHVGFKVKDKLFVIAGNDSLHVTVKASIDEQAALILHPKIEKAAYVGRHGWVTLEVDDEEMLELCLELAEVSYRHVAPKRLKA